MLEDHVWVRKLNELEFIIGNLRTRLENILPEDETLEEMLVRIIKENNQRIA